MPKRLRFSLRTLLALVTIFACGCGWLYWRLEWIRARHEFLRRTRDGLSSTFSGTYFEGQPLPWQLRIFGEKRVNYFRIGCAVPENDHERIKVLFPEADMLRVPDLMTTRPPYADANEISWYIFDDSDGATKGSERSKR